MKRFVDAVVCAGALCAALATGGCWWLFGDDDDYEHVTDDPVTCDDEGYWPGDFSVYSSDSILQLAGCRYIQGDLIVDGTGLSNLHGFEGIEKVGGSLRIADNPSLERLDGLERLFEVDGNVVVTDNGALGDVDGLGDLVAIGGALEIRWCPALESVAGLDELRFLGGDELSISDNPIPYCEVEALAAWLVANGFDGEVDISGTGSTECGEADAGVEADGGLDGGA